MFHARRSLTFGSCLALFASLSVPAAHASDFYAGKTITLIVGYPIGGPPDIFSRLASRYLPRHIPGNPSIVVQNMPGAGSVRAANYVYNSAARDGTVMALVAPTLPLEERLGAPAVKYKSMGFSWVGRMATAPDITFIMNTSPVKTIDDAFKTEAVLGATGGASTNFIYPNVMNAVLGTKFKIVAGYEGSANVMLAMDRGEVQGASSTYDGLMNLHPDWVKTKRVNIIVQYSLTRDPDLPNVSTMVELAKTPEQRQILRAVSAAAEIGKAFITPPGVPKIQIAVLRHALDETVKDPDYIADAQRLRIGLNPLSGEKVQDLINEVEQLPAGVVEKVKAIYPLS